MAGEELTHGEDMRVVLLVRLTASQKRRLMDVARRVNMTPSELVSKAVELAAMFL